jgi:hypothetical protein
MHVKVSGLEIAEFSREEFFAERWVYTPGEHVTFLAPTGFGKTTLTTTALDHTISPSLPVLSIGLKAHDKTLTAQNKHLGLKRLRDWPPLIMGKTPGWCVWPPLTGDPELDDYRLGEMIYKILVWLYRNAHKAKRSGIILNADEMEEIQRLLGEYFRRRRGGGSATQFLRGIYRRWRSSGGGIWTGCQAPKWLITDAYSMASHLFLGNDPTKSNRERFGEIGGIADHKMIEAVVLELQQYCWLYLRRAGRVMCVIGP